MKPRLAELDPSRTQGNICPANEIVNVNKERNRLQIFPDLERSSYAGAGVVRVSSITFLLFLVQIHGTGLPVAMRTLASDQTHK
jgi:hypothetical protein